MYDTPQTRLASAQMQQIKLPSLQGGWGGGMQAGGLPPPSITTRPPTEPYVEVTQDVFDILACQDTSTCDISMRVLRCWPARTKSNHPHLDGGRLLAAVLRLAPLRHHLQLGPADVITASAWRLCGCFLAWRLPAVDPSMGLALLQLPAAWGWGAAGRVGGGRLVPLVAAAELVVVAAGLARATSCECRCLSVV